MKGKLLIVGMALLAVFAVGRAQNFSVENDDGMLISYSVTSADDLEVAVAAGNYYGRVAVPATVAYNGQTYTVTSVAKNAFNGSGVTYIHLPATIVTLNQFAFRNCQYLDTLQMDATVPPIVANRSLRYLFGPKEQAPLDYGNAGVKRELQVLVPCGSLAQYRADFWGQLPGLTSPCATIPITVLTSVDSLYRVDSIVYSDGNQSNLHYSNRNYEMGDTARVMAVRWQERDERGYSTYPRLGWFLGWSNGETALDFSFVVEHADTIVCIADTLHHKTLSASRISTPVFQFGTLNYNGQANYCFPDLSHPAVSISYDEEYNEIYDTLDYLVTPSSVYATGLWVGSSDSLSYQRDNRVLGYDSTVTARTAVSRFFTEGTDYYPGPLRLTDGGTDAQTVMDYNRVWKVTREMIDYHIAHVADADYEMDEEIRTWPGNGPEGYAEQLAPYYDADSNGRYNPRAGDYPLIRGDECIFSIFNDAFGEHYESYSQSLGIEVHAMTYAFHEPADTALWNTVFVHYDIYNRSAVNHPNTFFGTWSDFDLGYAYDDLMGCDVRRGMYYVYNGDDYDGPGTGNFMGVPPAQGCVILGGATMTADGQDNPAITEVPGAFVAGNVLGNNGINGMNFGDGIVDNERLGMTSYLQYNNSYNAVVGEPEKATDYYNFMHAYWKNWQHLKYGGYGTDQSNPDASFMYPNDSDPWHWGTDGVVPTVDPDGWNEISSGELPGDRRGIAGSGPFTFTAGSLQQFDLAYVTGFGNEGAWSSVEAMQRNTDNVRRQFLHDTTDSGRPFLYRPYSAPLAIGDAADVPSFRLYPNPTRDAVTLTGVAKGSEVEVLDMMGRRLTAVRAEGTNVHIDLQAYPASVYFVRVGAHVQRVVKR